MISNSSLALFSDIVVWFIKIDLALISILSISLSFSTKTIFLDMLVAAVDSG